MPKEVDNVFMFGHSMNGHLLFQVLQCIWMFVEVNYFHSYSFSAIISYQFNSAKKIITIFRFYKAKLNKHLGRQLIEKKPLYTSWGFNGNYWFSCYLLSIGTFSQHLNDGPTVDKFCAHPLALTFKYLKSKLQTNLKNILCKSNSL